MVIEEELPESKKSHYYYELAKPDLYENKPPNPNYYHQVNIGRVTADRYCSLYPRNGGCNTWFLQARWSSLLHGR
jgi:hypothetical protein